MRLRDVKQRRKLFFLIKGSFKPESLDHWTFKQIILLISKNRKIFLADRPGVFVVILKDISVAAFKRLPRDNIQLPYNMADAFGKAATGEVFSHSKEVENEFTM